MGNTYIMKKNGFGGLVGYTVGQIENLLTSIKIVSINGGSAETNYKIQEDDKAIIAVETPQKKNVFIKD
jgi:hypothetical protein